MPQLMVESGRVSRSIESRNQLNAAHSKRIVTVFLQAPAHGNKKGGSCYSGHMPTFSQMWRRLMCQSRLIHP
jgi:hypothetical protein